MRRSNKQIVSLLLTMMLGIATLFFYNNCGQSFEAIGTSAELSSVGEPTTPPPPIPGVPPPIVTAQEYFTKTVLPLYRARCIACHVTNPREAVGQIATDRIYNYTFAKQYALAGTNATTNDLYTNMIGTNHAGGNQCVGDVKGTVTPCKETKTWILMENPLLSDGIAGNTNYVNIFGEVRGWALDPVDRAAKIKIVVYADMPFDAGGTLINTYDANLAGTNAVEDGHVFKFQLPANFANGAQRRLFIYGKTAAAANLIPNAPVTYTAFTGTAAGAATFTNEVAPKLVTCNRCHDWTKREFTFPYLVSPSPINGGTAARNTMIDNAAGIQHSGGSFCGGNQTNEPCPTLQKWWRDEGLGL